MRRILFISSSWPHGPSFGGQIRALHLARALKQLGELKLLIVSSDADNADAEALTADEFDTLPPMLPAICGGEGMSLKLRRAFDPAFMNVHGYIAGMPDRLRLQRMLEEYDLVWVLNSRTPNILLQWHWPRAHLDVDDVPSTYLRTVAQNGRTSWQRWKARFQQRLMHRRERLLLTRFTTLSVCSTADKRYLGSSERIHVIPNGFERTTLNPGKCTEGDTLRLGFIGLYSYAPNLEGMRWFLRECWPGIRRAVPGIRLRLVGKDCDGVLKPADPDVDALGWVADPADEIATWAAMIVPVRFGGGTRIKIAEAFSRRCPAVSTTIGAFGYEVEHGKHLLLADGPDAFIDSCVRLARDREFGVALAERAWQDYVGKWTWDAITPKIHGAAEDCLRRSNVSDAAPAPS